MKAKPDESYEDWIERVKTHELKIARLDLAKGMPIEEVLEKLSIRLMKKTLHPILTNIKKNTNNYEWDAEKSRKAYEEQYLNNVKPAADHVSKED